MDFNSLGLDSRILNALRYLGYTEPTPVQVETIPAVLTGKDVVASSETGSGKTAAFLLPIAHRLLKSKRQDRPRALVLVPTRELAVQTIDSLQKMERTLHLRSMAIYGGQSGKVQAKGLKAGVDVVAATPGRLLDLIQEKTIDLGGVETFVLDEADRMLDMGFLKDVRRAMSHLPDGRQNLVLSATLPKEVRDLIHSIVHDPIRIRVGAKDAMPAELKHAVYACDADKKQDLLAKLVSDQDVRKALVFVSTKRDAERVYYALAKAGVACERLHGDLSQRHRMHALEMFDKRQVPVLVATDVAARGLDISKVSHVIHYDVPLSADHYLHRSGRTARAEAAGLSWSLISPQEEKRFTAIERELKMEVKRVKVPGFEPRRDRPGKFRKRDPFTTSNQPKARQRPKRYPWQ